MSRINCYKLSIIFFCLFIISCATYDAQYDDSVTNWNTKSENLNNEIDHTFYFIGDGGKSSETSNDIYFSQLKKELSSSLENTSLIFLGDNIYEKGMPKKGEPNRAAAEAVLDAQISLATNFNGNTLFIPGNHDYYNNGVQGLEREAKYITEKLNDKDAFLPKDGCPLKKVDISDDIVLIIVDTQWYLEDWDKNPTMNDDCEIKTRTEFFVELEGLIKKSISKTTIIAMHHPMFTNGTHGGQFSLKQQLYPSSNKIPLPVLGSIANVVRKTSGVSPQDLQNKLYIELKNRIVTMSQYNEKVIFVSGHDHNLQYILKDNKPQIVSGAGSKSLGARVINGGKFSYGGIGYAKVVVYKNGASWVYYYSENNGERKLLFKTKIHEAEGVDLEYHYSDNFPETIKASIYNKEDVNKSKSYNYFLGEHYRTLYGTEIAAKTVLLDTLFGGLTPVRKGGGHQSRSLRLEDKDGKEYVMRAMKKSATQFIETVAFKDKYVEGQFDDTYTEKILLDFYTAAHPYTPFIIGTLSDAADIYHSNPKLYYIPKQNGLKHFNAEFGDELYMIEERSASGHGELESFGFSNKIISTEDLLKNLRKSDDNKLDESSFIRARLFDMLIGDWDRHLDQWRWAEFEDGKRTVYKPVPRDRDQGFSKFDGLILQIITRIAYGARMMQEYDDDIRNVKKFNGQAYALDMTFMSHSTYEDWLTQVEFLQQNITDDVIDKAFDELPNEVKDATIAEIKPKFKNRLKNLNKIAKEYYSIIEKYAIVTGTDKDNWFDIDRLNNGSTSVKIYNIKDGEKGSLFYDKLYTKDKTHEIWIYGLDDKDVFNVSGEQNDVIRLKLIGGQNNDTYAIESGKKVTSYDFKSKNNTFTTTKGKRKLIDDYDINSYNYKKYKYKRNVVFPTIGFNPDDGIRLGINNVFTTYGYERNPFSQEHTIKASYYFATSGFDLMYKGEFANVFDHWNVVFESKFTSPNYSINFYGLGNESINNEDDLGEDYHRVKLSTYGFYPSLKWIGRSGGEFKFGTLYESVEIEKTEGRYIDTFPSESEDRKNYVGSQATYIFANGDDETFPTLAFKAMIDTGWKTNINSSEHFTFITPSIAMAYKLDSNGKVVLASKIKGNFIIGDDYEFYYGASIGGKNGLRGYRNQRFIGDRSFYQNTDLRFHLGDVKTRLIPLKLGLFGGFDYGRVWLDGEDSNDWKTSYGAGFWLVGAEMINLNFSVFKSEDGIYTRFGFGFNF